MSDEPAIHPKLAKVLIEIWDEGLRMRQEGASLEAKLEHWYDRVMTFVRRHHWISSERDLASWMCHQCPICQDNGWEETQKPWRGEMVTAYKRCTCKPAGMSQRSDHDVASQVSGSWKQVGRR